ncbi:MAG: ubiquinol-cytochrome C chaperone family protein [Mesorhizobium sp.]|jgi:cytochrome b pre-mRNA-processing protein 3
MFQRLLGRRNTANRAVIDALYGQIVAAARQPVLYSDWQVPDTPLGRFEMLALHVFLVLHRLRGEGAPLAELAQELTDRFFADVDDALRALGIGDIGVPKRIKKLARMFYGRAAAYGEALDRGDAPALAAALARNVAPGVPDWRGAEPLAGYALRADRDLAGQSAGEIASGRLYFPAAGTTLEGKSSIP